MLYLNVAIKKELWENMARERKQLDLTNENINPFKVIAWLAWPVFVEQILSTLVSFADTAMVGALGPNATASVSISNSVVFLLNGAVMALGIGFTAYVARSVGAKDYDAAKAYIRHALMILFCLGVPLSIFMMFMHRAIPAWMGAAPEILDTAAQYVLITSSFRVFSLATMMLSSVFRGVGDTKTPLRINAGVNVLNVVGNYFLINPCRTVSIFGMEIWMPGAGWGVAGAAAATGFSWLIGGSLMAILLFTRKGPTQISLKDSWKPDWALLKRVVKISVPAVLERICMSGAGIISAKAIASLGTAVVAANSVFSTAESMSFMPAMAFQTSCTTLVGQSLGAKKPKLAEKYTWCNITLGGVLLSFAGLALYLFSEQLCGIFTPDPEVRALAAQSLRIVSVIQPIQAMAWIFAGALRGAGDTKWPFYITAICNWGIRTLGVVICVYVLGFSLPSTIVCMCLDNTARCIWMMARFRAGHWKTALQG